MGRKLHFTHRRWTFPSFPFLIFNFNCFSCSCWLFPPFLHFLRSVRFFSGWWSELTLGSEWPFFFHPHPGTRTYHSAPEGGTPVATPACADNGTHHGEIGKNKTTTQLPSTPSTSPEPRRRHSFSLDYPLLASSLFSTCVCLLRPSFCIISRAFRCSILWIKTLGFIFLCCFFRSFFFFIYFLVFISFPSSYLLLLSVH